MPNKHFFPQKPQQFLYPKSQSCLNIFYISKAYLMKPRSGTEADYLSNKS